MCTFAVRLETCLCVCVQSTHKSSHVYCTPQNMSVRVRAVHTQELVSVLYASKHVCACTCSPHTRARKCTVRLETCLRVRAVHTQELARLLYASKRVCACTCSPHTRARTFTVRLETFLCVCMQSTHKSSQRIRARMARKAQLENPEQEPEQQGVVKR